MEGFLFIIEIVFGTLDLLGFGFDIYSWIKGKDNRVERSLARKAGSEVPPRDKWNRRVLFLTLAVFVLTAALLLRNWLR